MLTVGSFVEGSLARAVVTGTAGGSAYLALLLPANDTVARTWSQHGGAEAGR
jgi:hypothetical protein